MPNPPERFSDLYEQHRADLYTYLVRSVRDENTAMDLVQDVYLNFFRVYRDRPLPADDVQCRMYLFRTARNLVINHVGRAYNRRVQLVGEYSGTEQSVTAGVRTGLEDSVVDRLNHEAAEGRLQELLGKLPEDERSALVLRHTLGGRLEDIASVLEVSVATASRMVKRAEKRLLQLARLEGDGVAEFPK